MTEANLIIYCSINGRDVWAPVLPAEVPEWVKDPDIMGRLVAGEMCSDVAEGVTGSLWYRAEKVSVPVLAS